ncbi:DUF1403 family protein [Mesorhizobium sp. 43Arga]
MIRLDPATASPAVPPTVPAWALTSAGALNDADAAFRAGAALASLDTLARAQPAWVGAWRQRLALKCAAASMRLAGRAEDEAALRDAWQHCPAGADPGPAGAIFGAWRQLALQPPIASADRLERIVDQLGLHWDGEAPGAKTVCRGSARRSASGRAERTFRTMRRHLPNPRPLPHRASNQIRESSRPPPAAFWSKACDEPRCSSSLRKAFFWRRR